MNKTIKLLAVSAAVLLSGCVGQTASFGDRMHDSFLFTSAAQVAPAEVRCVSLSQQFTFQSGSVTYTLPSGRYKGTRKNDSGYFYYAPSSITSSSWFYGSSEEGIYINNEFNSGNLFMRKADGFDDRPIRGVTLPDSIFSYLSKIGKC